MLPVSRKLSADDFAYIKSDIRTLAETIKVLSNVKKITQANLYWIDMDLLGLPIRVTVGRDFVNGEVELKLRKEDKINKIKLDKLVNEIKKIIKTNS